MRKYNNLLPLAERVRDQKLQVNEALCSRCWTNPVVSKKGGGWEDQGNATQKPQYKSGG